MTAPQTANLNTSLSSLAMLSLRMQQGKDYLDYLERFVLEAIRGLGEQAFDAVHIQKIIESEFGLKIPAATLAIYLKRLMRPGYVVRTTDGLQFKVGHLPASTINSDRQAANGQINHVIVKLKDFAKSKYSLDWNEEHCAALLTEFLRDYSIDFVRYSEFKSPLPDPGTDTKAAEYVVASFVKDSVDSHPDVFECINTLVQSHILSNALMCPDLAGDAGGFRGVVFIADTRIITKALDLESIYDTDNILQLLKTIQRLKGVLCVFPETKDELRTLLKAIIVGFQQGNVRGLIPRELRARGRGVADVIFAESNLEQRLKDLGFTTIQSPGYDESTYPFQIDETELRSEIEEIGYSSDKAIQHDVHAVRNILALRKGRHVSRIEDAGYVFLTNNGALAHAAFAFERRNTEGWVTSSVITDYHLSHLAWLKAPMDASNLPRTELLASCYAAMRPHESFWRHYLSELDRLKSEGKVSEHDHEVLRYSLNAPEELMEVTRGDVDGINESSFHLIREKLEKHYASEKEEALAKEQAHHEATRKALEAATAALTAKEAESATLAEHARAVQEGNAQAGARIHKLEQDQQALLIKSNARMARMDKFANSVATTGFVLLGTFFGVVGVLSVLSYISPWLAVPSAVIGTISLVSGCSGTSLKAGLRDWVKNRVGHYFE